jgi:GT2 family glycosyltransferase
LGLILDKPLALLAGRAGPRGALRWLLGALSAKYRLPDSPQRVIWVSGAAFCCKRSAWEQIGGFDEAFFLYHEDVDLCLRAAQAGWEVWHVPEAVILHHSGASFARDQEAQKGAYYTSQRYLFRKHTGWLTLYPLIVLQGLYWRLGLYRRLSRDHISRPASSTQQHHTCT